MRDSTFDMLKSELANSKLQDPLKTRWTTKEFEVLIGGHIRSAGLTLQPGTLHVRVHRAIRRAIAEGILQKVSRGLFEVVESWGHAHIVGTAVARALRSASEKKLQASHLGLGLDRKRNACIFAAVLCKGGWASEDHRLVEGLTKIQDFLAGHPGVVVVYSMRVTILKGQKGRSALVWPY